MTTNPLVSFREREHLTRNELAALLDADYQTVYHVETGYRRPPLSWFERLAEVGFDPARLREDYQTWWSARSREILQRLEARRGG